MLVHLTVCMSLSLMGLNVLIDLLVRIQVPLQNNGTCPMKDDPTLHKNKLNFHHLYLLKYLKLKYSKHIACTYTPTTLISVLNLNVDVDPVYECDC